MPTLLDAIIVVCGAFAGGFVSGLAGFGTGLVALGFWLHAVPPLLAAPLVAVCSVAAQAQTMPMIWHAVDRRRLWPILAAGLCGMPIGVYLLGRIDPDSFRLALGLFLIAFAVFMLIFQGMSPILWGGRLADAAIGFLGGILGGLAGLSGPLPTIWATIRGWTKDQRRSVFQTFNFTVLAAVVLWYFLSNGLATKFGWLMAFALPGTFAGAWVGSHTYLRLSDKRFNEIVLTLLGISGLTLVWAGI